MFYKLSLSILPARRISFTCSEYVLNFSSGNFLMNCIVSIMHPSTILISSSMPLTIHFFMDRIYLCMMYCYAEESVEKRRGRRYMASNSSFYLWPLLHMSLLSQLFV